MDKNGQAQASDPQQGKQETETSRILTAQGEQGCDGTIILPSLM